MSKEANGARRVFLMLFCGIAVMISSLWAGSVETASANDNGAWVFPGEYESHQAMWMLWPTYENKAGFPSTDPMSDMIRAFLRARQRSPEDEG